MDVLMNGLLLTATLFAGGYCWILSRRVRDLKSLDTGLGGAIVTLTRQIELARGTLEEARTATREKARDLSGPLDDPEDMDLPVWAGIVPMQMTFGEPVRRQTSKPQ